MALDEPLIPRTESPTPADVVGDDEMNSNNLRLARRVQEAIQNLENGTSTLAETQFVLENVVPPFENDGSDLQNAIRLAAADLEEIQFTTLRDEQVPAAISRLDNLRAAVPADTESQ